MPIKLACVSCETKLSVKDDLAGRSIKCPKCTSVVKVPAGDTPTVAKTAAATRKEPTAPSPKTSPAPARGDTSVSKVKAKPKPPPEEEEDLLEEEPAPARKKNSAAPARSAAPASKAKPKRRDDDLDEEELDEIDDDGREVRKDGLDLDLEWEVPEKYQQQIDDEMSKGEKLVWCGQPSRRITLIRSLPVAILGCIIFIGGLIAVLVAAFNSRPGQAGGVLIGGLVGGGFSIFMMLSPFWKLFQASRTCYALTTRRCVVWRCEWYGGVTMDNYTPAYLTNMFRRDMWFFGKGGGDVVFKTRTIVTTTHHRNSRGGYGGSSTSVQTIYYGFLGVERAREVEKLVRETLVDRLVDKLTY